MSRVIHQLWGHHPSFLSQQPHQHALGGRRPSLWSLVGHLPKTKDPLLPGEGSGSFGVGRKVIPTHWFNQGRTKNYFKINHVNPTTHQVWGTRFRGGRPASPIQLLPDNGRIFGVLGGAKTSLVRGGKPKSGIKGRRGLEGANWSSASGPKDVAKGWGFFTSPIQIQVIRRKLGLLK